MVVCVFNCLSILPAHAPKLMHTQYSLEPSGKIRFRIQFKEHWGGKDWRERERERSTYFKIPFIVHFLCYVFNIEYNRVLSHEISLSPPMIHKWTLV